MKRKQEDLEYIQKLLQDMRVKARDIENYVEGRKYKKLIKKFEKGFEEEYKHPHD